MEWRNDPETRRASRNTAAVEWKTHLTWLSEVLRSDAHLLRIAELRGKPVGTVRADRTAEGWEISWTVAPEERGKRLGRRMLIAFVNGLEGKLVARIRTGHTASAKVAVAAGFYLVSAAGEGEFESWHRRGGFS